MQQRDKLKELSISMAIGLLCLLVLVGISGNAMSAYVFGQSTYGEVIEYTVKRERPAYYSVTQRTPELHEILIEYSVNEQAYWLLVNAHVYSATGLIEVGDKMLVSYNEEHPQHAYVISYGLYSVLTSILAPVFLLILLFVSPQWVYYYRTSGKLSDKKNTTLTK